MRRLFQPVTRLGGISFGDMDPLPESGAYALILRAGTAVKVHTGVHGRFVLESGLYLYAGRAGRNLPHRLARHQKRSKPIRWHIDHLTSRKNILLEDILVLPEHPQKECEIVRACLNVPETRVPVRNFGNGDCREGCPSHLLMLSKI